MPERLANTDPFRQVTEMVGSGPYRFLPAEFNAGVRSAMNGSPRMFRAARERQSYTAGPKVTHFDRVEWQSLGDAATSVAALLQGEVDWLDSPSADQVPLLARNASVTVEVRESAWIDRGPCASTIFTRPSTTRRSGARCWVPLIRQT